jgi:hypothetical protein
VFVHQWMIQGQGAPNLSLPENQDDLVEAVASANKRTVVVLETGAPVSIPGPRGQRPFSRLGIPALAVEGQPRTSSSAMSTPPVSFLPPLPAKTPIYRILMSRP